MPGVLVESSTSPPHGFFPLALSSSSSSSSIACFDSSDAHSPRADPTPPSPVSPISHLPYLDPLGSCPSSPSFRVRDAAQRFLPKSNLGFGLNDYLTEFSLESSSDEIGGLRIPPPKNGLYTNGSIDSIGSPLFSDSNGVGSPVFSDAFSALHKFLPSNTNDDESWPADTFPATDAYSCDDFRMYEFKVRRCMRGRSHDWTECPFAHPGEKARRRDPRRIHYSGSACPDFRKGSCKRGDACEFAHGVFECWLHPARYRTQPCKDGRSCRRRVCFFAHTVEQLRVLPSASSAVTSSATGICRSRNLFSSFDGSSSRQLSPGPVSENADDECSTFMEDKRFVEPCPPRKAMDGNGFGSGRYGATLSSASALSTYLVASPPAPSPPLTPSSSPPMSPELCWQRNSSSKMHFNKTVLLNTSPVPLHRRHLNRLQTMPTISLPSDVADYAADPSSLDDMGFSLPVSAHLHSAHGNSVRELLHSLQTLQVCSRITQLQKSLSTPSSPQSLRYLTPYQSPLGQRLYSSIPGSPNSDSMWELSLDCSVETDVPRRVESGRDLRAELYGQIGKENGVDCNQDPDLGWVNDLVD